jgi:hypothetical protein
MTKEAAALTLMLATITALLLMMFLSTFLQ